MESGAKKTKETSTEGFKSRKNEARVLLKKCFKNTMFSLVPFEIWRDIVCETEVDVVARISQTCWGFKELVDNLRELILENALKYRREDKIPQAKICIMRCAEIGDSIAMFHVAFSCFNGGWGIKEDGTNAADWWKKSANRGNASAMAYYSNCLFYRYGVNFKDEELSNLWAKKALCSKDSFAIGCCHFWGLGTPKNSEKGFQLLKLAAEEGDEFGQRILGMYFENVNYKDAFYWYLKSAEQGLAISQRRVSVMLEKGQGCERNETLSTMWLAKALNQWILY